MFHKILLPVDGRHASILAARSGFQQAQAEGADVILVAVIPREIVPPYPVGFDASAEEHADLDQDTRIVLDWLEEDARRAGLDVAVRTCTGDPADEILRIAREEDVDLIVMAAHCRGPLALLVLGSVSQRVLRDATCPVQIYGKHADYKYAEADQAAAARNPRYAQLLAALSPPSAVA